MTYVGEEEEERQGLYILDMLFSLALLTIVLLISVVLAPSQPISFFVLYVYVRKMLMCFCVL